MGWFDILKRNSFVMLPVQVPGSQRRLSHGQWGIASSGASLWVGHHLVLDQVAVERDDE